MKYKLTVLNSATFLFLSGCVIYTIMNYSVLAKEEGWGVVYMVGLFIFGSTALIVDLIIQRLIKAKDIQIFLTILALAVYIVLFFLGS